MKRKILSILLALCLALTLLPVAAFAEGSEEELPVCTCETACAVESLNADCPVCGAEGASAENCAKYVKPADDVPTQSESEPVVLNGEDETVIELTQSNISNYMSSGLTDGSYKLGENVTVETGSLEVKGTVTLDLNGFTLKFTNPNQIPITIYGRNNSYTKNYPIGIYVKSQAGQSCQLTLADSSKAATGRLEMTGVNDNAIFVTDGELTMTGGTITNSHPGEIGRSLNMTGIAILRGKAAMTGGRIEKQKQLGVWVCASTFTMGGNAVISSCGTAADMTSSVGGGVLVNDNYVPYGKNDTQRTRIPSYFTLEGGARVENCAAKYGGGVSVGDNCLFTMTGGSITGCTAYHEGGGVVTEGYGPGSTSEDIKPVFIMSGGSISDCKAGDTYGGTGGGVSVGAMCTGTTGFSMFAMTGGTITGCKAANGGGVNIQGSSSFTMTNGSITDCEGLLGGGVELRQAHTGVAPTMFTMSGGSISGCKAADATDASGGRGGGVYMGSGCQLAMSGNARITGCEAARSGSGIYGINDASSPWQVPLFTRSDNAQVDKGVSMDYALQVGSGINDFQTVRMDGLGTEAYPYEIGTADQLKLFRQIVNGAQATREDAVLPPQNTGARAKLTGNIDLNNEEWTPIGYASAYDETKAYSGTFDGQGHTISGLNANATVSGLFGYAKNAAIKNLTVAGSVGGGSCLTAGGGIVGYAVGGTIENCGNLCGVAVPGSSPGGGIVGFASDLTIIGCYNAGLVHKGDGSRGGGIVGVGTNVKIYDCYNVGKVEGFSGQRGGIVGEASGPVFVYNCYNVGNVIEAGGTGDANKTVCGIVGGDGPVQIQNCYYLEGTKADAGATAKTAAEFADGTVLKLLINGRTDSPWDSTCKYVTAAGKTLPVFKGQGNAHEHSGAWTSNGDGTHSRTCACGVTETAKCSGGTATRTARAVCQVCGQPYGQLASGGGIRRQPTGGSGAANTSNTTKTVKSGNTGDMGVMLYAGMAVLSLTGGAWVVGKKRK